MKIPVQEIPLQEEILVIRLTAEEKEETEVEVSILAYVFRRNRSPVSKHTKFRAVCLPEITSRMLFFGAPLVASANHKRTHAHCS